MDGRAIADFARSKAGCGYVFGATGWICSRARREQQAAQYPEHKDNLLGLCAKWDGVACYDCAQLTRAAARAAGIALPSGATSQWNADVWQDRGEIGTLPDEAGVLLYRQSNGRMQHTGVYLGGGEAVDARGSRQGVVLSPVSSHSWTHWGRLREADHVEQALYQALVTADRGRTVNLRAAASTSGKRLCAVPLGERVDVLSEEGDWRRVRYQGETGYMMAKYLTLTAENTLAQRVTALETRVAALEGGGAV